MNSLSNLTFEDFVPMLIVAIFLGTAFATCRMAENKEAEIQRNKEEVESFIVSSREYTKELTVKAKATPISETLPTITEEPKPLKHQYTDAFRKMTDEEYDLLVRILALEAQGEPYEGQVAVIEIIMNRVIDDRFPDTIKGVLSQKGQFATWKWLNKPYNTPNNTQYEVVDSVIKNGLTVLPSTDYIYFATSKVNGRKFIQIKHHYFSK